LIGGFLAVSQAHSKQLGFIGLLGIVLFCLAAFLFEVVLSIVAIVLGKHTGPEAPTLLVIAGTILQFLGCILFGIRILHTRVFPRTLGWVLIVVAGLVIVSFALPESASELVITGNSVLLFLACGWLGYLVATQITEAITPPGNPATEIE
jgi:FtsH-binding integral membrane protein